MITINSKKVGIFLKGLNDAEYNYLQLTMQIVDGVNQLIKEFNLSKEEVCKHFEIKPNQYSDFIKGNRNYDLHDIARLYVARADLYSTRATGLSFSTIVNS